MTEKSITKTHLGIGFATGRKSFQKVLGTYVHSWAESGLTEDERVNLNLFVAYDLKYLNTKTTDYTNVSHEVREMLDNIHFIGNARMLTELVRLTGENVISEAEARLFLGNGYAAKRNAILFMALKAKMDYLLFLDDDEYPMSVNRTSEGIVWNGQQVLTTHLKYIKNEDITYGHHCGYISPIPHIRFNEKLSEKDFRIFIEAISNDILSWDSVKETMQNGGVTYADPNVLFAKCAEPVREINHAKFISGSNLCINLKKPERTFPFYNPPGARGEDTFLSTCLSKRNVLRVPCYAFHDGFSTYNHLLYGVLPLSLKQIKADNEKVVARFLRACVGWIRYKPLLVYLTGPEEFEDRMREISEKLDHTLPKLCAYFENEEFMKVKKEFESFRRNVKKHAAEFERTKQAWQKITAYFAQN